MQTFNTLDPHIHLRHRVHARVVISFGIHLKSTAENQLQTYILTYYFELSVRNTAREILAQGELQLAIIDLRGPK